MTSTLARRLAALAVFASPFAVGCSAPVDSIEPTGESTGETKEAMKNCTLDNPCDPPGTGDPPPPPPACGYDAIARYGTSWSWTSMNYDSTSKGGCVKASATTQLAQIEYTLINNYGCSAPIYVKRSNPNSPATDWWNAYILLCPASADSYMKSLAPSGPLPGANVAPHSNGSYGDLQIPAPPAGMVWAVPWQDPMCMDMGGCNVSHVAI